MFNFNFRLLDSEKDLRNLVDFLIKQDLKYPKYGEWIQRSEYEIDSGYKKVILALSYRRLVGDLIFQPHKELPGFKELKNLRIHPDVQGRYCSLFMLKQAEVEDRKKYNAIICDVHSDQGEVIYVLKLMGYTALTSCSLYDKNSLDIVMVKTFDKTLESGILYRSKELILSKSL